MHNLFKKILFALPLVAAFSSANAIPITDVQDYSTQTATTYFLNPAFAGSPTANSLYYRYFDGDWDWVHGAIAGTFSAATLKISAYDVDRPSNLLSPSNPAEEHDVISLYDGTSWVNIGELNGNDNIWDFTTFDLTSLFPTYSWLSGQISSGLQVAINIDSTHTFENWAVTLSKSELSVDGGSQICSPTPGVPCTNVPEPESLALFSIGFAALALNLMRRRKV